MIFLELADGSFLHLEGCYKLSVQNGEKIILTVCQSSYGWKELDLTEYAEYDNEYSSVKHGRTREDLKTDLLKLIYTINGQSGRRETGYTIFRTEWMKPALQEEGKNT